MMQKIHIDFGNDRHGSPWLGRVLLLVAGAVCLDAGLAYYSLRKSMGESETHLARRAPAGAPTKVSAQEVAAVRETVQRPEVAWEALVMALATRANDKVAACVIEPEPRMG